MARPIIRLLWCALALLLASAAALLPDDALSAAEARALWLLADPPRGQHLSDSPRAALEHVWDSLRAAADRTRAQGECLPCALPLDAWLALAGDNPLSLRLPALSAGLLALAASFPLARRFFGQRAAWMTLVLLLTLLLFVPLLRRASPYPLLLAAAMLALYALALRWALARPLLAALAILAWALAAAPLLSQAYRPHNAARAALEQAAAARLPAEPALLSLDPRQPAAFYAREGGFLQGISIDLSWRAFSSDEIAALVERLPGARALWLLLPAAVPLTDDISTRLLNDGWQIGLSLAGDGILLVRLNRR
ncbi:MAG: glycosyltransferase family 39 protein [Chloroflexi bacterium]|nr:glycosyltransferase family 39 protein [Chloroflexota bacterium]